MKRTESIPAHVEENLFVYGTLSPGGPNEHVLKAIGGRWDKARVAGHLNEEGWGSAMGYPGLVIDADGGLVEGYLFHSTKLRTHWHMLDDFEGEDYERVVVQALRHDGSWVEAFAYVIRGT